MKKIYPITVLSLFMLLSACGFQLRGYYVLPKNVDTIYITGNVSYAAMRQFRNSFERSGVKVVSSPDRAGATLIIHEEKNDRRVLSVGSTAKVSEYEIIYSMEYSFRLGQQKNLIDHQLVVQRRDFSFNENEVLSKEREEQILRGEMQREAIANILRRIARSSSKKK